MENNKGLAGLILGLVSLVCGILALWVFGWLFIPALVCGIIGIVLSSKGLKGENKLMPGLGLASSVIGLILAIIAIVFVIIYIVAAAEQASQALDAAIFLIA